MIRIPVNLAIVVALVMMLGASVAPAASRVATDEPDASAEVSALYRGAVTVGEDGNGVRADRFATTVGGSDVRYVLVVENGCADPDPDPVAPCPAAVTALTVTLNDDVVFQNTEEFTPARSAIVLNPVHGELNSVVIAARGAPGSGARVRILAVRGAPLEQA